MNCIVDEADRNAALNRSIVALIGDLQRRLVVACSSTGGSETRSNQPIGGPLERRDLSLRMFDGLMLHRRVEHQQY